MVAAGRRSDSPRAGIHTGVFMPAQVRELRRKAALCRRAASVPTSGSGNADRILLALAEQLERDAALRERRLQDGTSERLLDQAPADFQRERSTPGGQEAGPPHSKRG